MGKEFTLIFIILFVPIMFIIGNAFFSEVIYSINPLKQIGIMKLNCNDIFEQLPDHIDNIECSDNPLTITYINETDCNTAKYKTTVDCNIKGVNLYMRGCDNDTIINLNKDTEKYCNVFVEEL